MSSIHFFLATNIFFILQTILFSTREFELNQIPQSVPTQKLPHTSPPEMYIQQLLARVSSPQYLSLCSSVVWYNLIFPLRHSSRNPGKWWTKYHASSPFGFGVEHAKVTCWLWVERCSMALSASRGSLTLQSPNTASLPTDWIREWHVTFPYVMQWWLQRTFKCWCWKNHYLFSPRTASVILCSCIIFVLPRSLLWNNMLLRQACFQTSYLLTKIKILLQPRWDRP